MCDDVVDRYSLAGHLPALPHAKPSDDVDGCPGCQTFEVFDILAFPSDDVVPGGLDDCTSIMRGVAVVRCDGEVGTFGVPVVLDVNAPDDATDFNLV